MKNTRVAWNLRMERESPPYSHLLHCHIRGTTGRSKSKGVQTAVIQEPNVMHASGVQFVGHGPAFSWSGKDGEALSCSIDSEEFHTN